MYPGSINLLSPPSKPTSKSETLLEWVLLWGRVLTLITALFLVGVFAYRLLIDTKYNNLVEDTQVEYQNLLNLSGTQTKFLRIQRVVENLSSFQESQEYASTTFFIYTDYLVDVKDIEDISINGNVVMVTMIFESSDQFQEFEGRLTADPRICGEPQFSLEESYKDGVSPTIKVSVSMVLDDLNK